MKNIMLLEKGVSEACRAKNTNADCSAHRTSSRVLLTGAKHERCKQGPNVAVHFCDLSTWTTEEAGVPRAGDQLRLCDGQIPQRNTKCLQVPLTHG